MTKVFIGSTSKDLAAYREAALNTCLKLDMQPIAMEHFEAMGVGAVEGSKRKLDPTDLYVGIFAFRYGYIETGYDKSVTEIEFDHAGILGLERLCFFAKSDYPFPPSVIDVENQEKLKTFRDRVYKSLIIAEFTTVESFTVQLMQALVKWRERLVSTATTESIVRVKRLEGDKQTTLIETQLRLITLGRAPNSTLQLSDNRVSWEHGQIVFKFGTYHYLHLSKTNSTILRRRGEEYLLRPAKDEEYELRNLDRLIIGDTTFIVELTLFPEDRTYTPTSKDEEG